MNYKVGDIVLYNDRYWVVKNFTAPGYGQKTTLVEVPFYGQETPTEFIISSNAINSKDVLFKRAVQSQAYENSPRAFSEIYDQLTNARGFVEDVLQGSTHANIHSNDMNALAVLGVIKADVRRNTQRTDNSAEKLFRFAYMLSSGWLTPGSYEADLVTDINRGMSLGKFNTEQVAKIFESAKSFGQALSNRPEQNGIVTDPTQFVESIAGLLPKAKTFLSGYEKSADNFTEAQHQVLRSIFFGDTAVLAGAAANTDSPLAYEGVEGLGRAVEGTALKYDGKGIANLSYAAGLPSLVDPAFGRAVALNFQSLNNEHKRLLSGLYNLIQTSGFLRDTAENLERSFVRTQTRRASAINHALGRTLISSLTSNELSLMQPRALVDGNLMYSVHLNTFEKLIQNVTSVKMGGKVYSVDDVRARDKILRMRQLLGVLDPTNGQKVLGNTVLMGGSTYEKLVAGVSDPIDLDNLEVFNREMFKHMSTDEAYGIQRKHGYITFPRGKDEVIKQQVVALKGPKIVQFGSEDDAFLYAVTEGKHRFITDDLQKLREITEINQKNAHVVAIRKNQLEADYPELLALLKTKKLLAEDDFKPFDSLDSIFAPLTRKTNKHVERYSINLATMLNRASEDILFADVGGKLMVPATDSLGLQVVSLSEAMPKQIKLRGDLGKILVDIHKGAKEAGHLKTIATAVTHGGNTILFGSNSPVALKNQLLMAKEVYQGKKTAVILDIETSMVEGKLSINEVSLRNVLDGKSGSVSRSASYGERTTDVFEKINRILRLADKVDKVDVVKTKGETDIAQIIRFLEQSKSHGYKINEIDSAIEKLNRAYFTKLVDQSMIYQVAEMSALGRSSQAVLESRWLGTAQTHSAAIDTKRSGQLDDMARSRFMKNVGSVMRTLSMSSDDILLPKTQYFSGPLAGGAFQVDAITPVGFEKVVVRLAEVKVVNGQVMRTGRFHELAALSPDMLGKVLTGQFVSSSAIKDNAVDLAAHRNPVTFDILTRKIRELNPFTSTFYDIISDAQLSGMTDSRPFNSLNNLVLEHAVTVKPDEEAESLFEEARRKLYKALANKRNQNKSTGEILDDVVKQVVRRRQSEITERFSKAFVDDSYDPLVYAAKQLTNMLGSGIQEDFYTTFGGLTRNAPISKGMLELMDGSAFGHQKAAAFYNIAKTTSIILAANNEKISNLTVKVKRQPSLTLKAVVDGVGHYNFRGKANIDDVVVPGANIRSAMDKLISNVLLNLDNSSSADLGLAYIAKVYNLDIMQSLEDLEQAKSIRAQLLGAVDSARQSIPTESFSNLSGYESIENLNIGQIIYENKEETRPIRSFALRVLGDEDVYSQLITDIDGKVVKGMPIHTRRAARSVQKQLTRLIGAVKEGRANPSNVYKRLEKIFGSETGKQVLELFGEAEVSNPMIFLNPESSDAIAKNLQLVKEMAENQEDLSQYVSNVQERLAMVKRLGYDENVAQIAANMLPDERTALAMFGDEETASKFRGLFELEKKYGIFGGLDVGDSLPAGGVGPTGTLTPTRQALNNAIHELAEQGNRAASAVNSVAQSVDQTVQAQASASNRASTIKALVLGTEQVRQEAHVASMKQYTEFTGKLSQISKLSIPAGIVGGILGLAALKNVGNSNSTNDQTPAILNPAAVDYSNFSTVRGAHTPFRMTVQINGTVENMDGIALVKNEINSAIGGVAQTKPGNTFILNTGRKSTKRQRALDVIRYG